jgi:hypothetical protein
MPCARLLLLLAKLLRDEKDEKQFAPIRLHLKRFVQSERRPGEPAT